MTLKDFLKSQQLSSFIDNQHTPCDLKHSTPIISPVTKEAWKSITPATDLDVKNAIKAAHGAFEAWSHTPAPTRAFHLRDVAYLLHENKTALAEVMALEMGKPIAEGEKEVDYAAGFCEWFAGEAERLYGLTIPSHYKNKKLSLSYQPVGVCGIITPWNFPIAMLARKVAAALAAGCTVVCKPSPECPVSALAFAEIMQQVGVPSGVMNVVVGPEEMIGNTFMGSDQVRKISFTGSLAVGRSLYSKCALTMKTITLELGGHAPLIVFDDADIDVAVRETINAKFRNNGQTCVAPNRIYVHSQIYNTYVSKLVDAIRKLKVGSPLERETEISEVLHPSVEKRLHDQIVDAVKKGAYALLQGSHSYEPTVFDRVTPDMTLYYEETFGPVVPLISFEKEAEVIQMANDTQFGLAAYLFTKDLERAHTVSSALEYGVIGLNDGLPSAPEGSFGGVKSSGFGREGGPNGIKEFLEEKYVSLSL